MAKYNYTVSKLLSEAKRPRTKYPSHNPGFDTDHVIELQLVVAALNRLPLNTYYADGWQQKLVDFFNDEMNMQLLTTAQNQAKGQAVGRLIRDERLSQTDIQYIQHVSARWRQIRNHLQGFERFKEQMNQFLAS